MEGGGRTLATYQRLPNIYREARKAANIGQIDAALELHMSDRTLKRIETFLSEPDGYTVLRMEEVYGDKRLAAKHCSTMCPIGQKYNNIIEDKDLPQAAIGVQTAYDDLEPDIKRMLRIAQDGIISEDEIPDTKEVMRRMNNMKKSIEDLMGIVFEVIPPEEVIQKEKPLRAVL